SFGVQEQIMVAISTKKRDFICGGCFSNVLKKYRKKRAYILVFESITIVTGPSLSSDTFMSAPKIPLSVLRPEPAILFLKYSNSGIAFGGFAAPMKDGRLPFL